MVESTCGARENDPQPRSGRNIGSEYGGKERWPSESAAFEGVPVSEKREHTGTQGCHRCGRNGHRAAQWYAATTIKGTSLPAAPWKVSAGTKRRWEDEKEDDTKPAPKTQKTAAAAIMDTEPMWESEEDF